MNSLESIHTYDIRKQKQKRNKRLEVLLEKNGCSKNTIECKFEVELKLKKHKRENNNL